MTADCHTYAWSARTCQRGTEKCEANHQEGDALRARADELEAAVERMTPGPWSVASRDDGRSNPGVESADIVRDDHGKAIASLHIVFWKQDRRDARPDAHGMCALRNSALPLVRDLMAENERLREAFSAIGNDAEILICDGILDCKELRRAEHIRDLARLALQEAK